MKEFYDLSLESDIVLAYYISLFVTLTSSILTTTPTRLHAPIPSPKQYPVPNFPYMSKHQQSLWNPVSERRFN